MARDKTETVMGHRLPPPRLTRWARIYALLYLGVPLLLVLLAMDVVGYLIFRFWLERCYGILCLF